MGKENVFLIFVTPARLLRVLTIFSSLVLEKMFMDCSEIAQII
jgi:hypothetical protein